MIIDPTVKAVTSEDTWLESTGINGNATQFLICKVAGYNKKRALIKFDLSGVPANATVLNAQMKLYYYSTGGSGWVDRWLQAHQVLVNWNEAQATKDYRLTSTDWNVDWVGLNDIDANDTFESTMLFKQNEYPVWKIWDLTALTQKWVNLTANNYGVVLWATNEATDGYDLRFYSSEYTTDPTKQPKLEITYSTTAKTVYFLKDHLGSVRATVDNAGAVVGYDDYDAWGYTLVNRSLATPWSSLQGTAKNKFTGKEFDDDYGVNYYYFGARYYDPQIGRWMVRDPLADKTPSLTPYHYVGNNPLTYIDIAGLDSIFYNQQGEEINRIASKDDFFFLSHNNKGNKAIRGKNYYQGLSKASFFGDYTNKDAKLFSKVDEASVPNDEAVVKIVDKHTKVGETWIGFAKESPEGLHYDYKNKVLGPLANPAIDNTSTAYLYNDLLYNRNEIGNVLWGATASKIDMPLLIARAGAQFTAIVYEKKIDEPPEQRAISIGYNVYSAHKK